MSGTEADYQRIAGEATIERLWAEAVNPLDAGQTMEQAPFFGANLRIDLLKSVQAAWETANVVFSTMAAVHQPFDPVTWMSIGGAAASAGRTIIASFVQSMRPIDYVTYVILSQTPDGLTEAELSAKVKGFLFGEKVQPFAWYLGMDRAGTKAAADASNAAQWFEIAIKKLEEAGLARKQEGHINAVSRHFTMGWKPE